jgi:uncharacterized small protein (TIGR04563 family)
VRKPGRNHTLAPAVFLSPALPPLTFVSDIGTPSEEPRVKGDKKKQSLYFPVDMLAEMQHEADRQERPLSWIMQQAWKLSRDKIQGYPGVEDL